MTEYTRLTIIGSTRKAEMVVPGDEAIGSLIPRLMHLLDERPGAVSRPLTLVRSTGEQLDTSLSVTEQNVVDGELLRLLREDAAPPPPEVADVTDVLAESHDDRADLWVARSRRAVALASIGATAAVGGELLARSVLGAVGGIGTIIAVALLVAVIAARTGGRWIGAAATALAVGLCVPLGFGIAVGLDSAALSGAAGAMQAARTAFAIAAPFWAAIAIGVGAGLGQRPAWWGGVVGALLSALPLVLVVAGVADIGALGITAVAATLVCGLLPWYAMSASGLTGLDDQVVEGRLKRRDAVLVTVRGAYRTLTWSTAAVAVPLGVSAAALLASSNGWALGLGVATVVVVASRTRAMPLIAQGYALWAAAVGAVLVGGVWHVLPGGAIPIEVVLAVFGALVIAAVVAAGVTPAAHQSASLRRIGNLVEAVAVAAMLPVLVGLFGVYSDLLAAF